jgi:DNA-binding Lrp family transcriptional regulator
MNQTDMEILNLIQTEYPIVSSPYAEIGKKVNLTEAETLARVRALKQKGIIRRIGANFHSRKLGWKSTLCCAMVPKEKVQDFVNQVNKYPGVTHNYMREHRFNIWFTYIGPSWSEIEKDIQEITKNTGIEVLNLPAVKTFKIRVDFRMQSDE